MRQDWRTLRGSNLAVSVDSGPGQRDRPVLWPSLGEYSFYDEFLYQALGSDKVRNSAFRAAIAASCRGRRVIDIGSGADLLWALEAAANGASSVLAVEGQTTAYSAAAELTRASTFPRNVALFNGMSSELHAENLAEVCVAEVIGTIATSEGVLSVFADARRRLLSPGFVAIPQACRTLVAPVSLWSLFPGGIGFAADSVPYIEKIFDANGGPFDIRLVIAGLDPACVLSSGAVVENIQLDGTTPLEDSSVVELEVEREGPVDGLLLWIQLDVGFDTALIDSLLHRTTWAPAYFPLFDENIEVAAGDKMRIRFERRSGLDGVHPDYLVDAELCASGVSYRSSFTSAFGGSALGSAAVYRKLFTC